MKVVAFNGSPRREGNTAQIIKIVLGELAKHGVETEVVQVGGIGLRGCTSCFPAIGTSRGSAPLLATL